MEIRPTIEKVVVEGGEDFIRARDKGHAESMRVTAFNYRRKMPEQLVENIGIQVVVQDSIYFLRIFDRKIDGAEHWVRDEVSGKLIPAPVEEQNAETQRMVRLMREAGKTEEEIKAAI